MLKAKHGKGVMVRTPNRVGVLAEFSKIVAENGLIILAMSAWVQDAEAVIRLICEDAQRMIDVLRDNGYDAQDRDVVLVEAEDQPGILQHVAETLTSKNIDIRHLFTSAVDKNECVAVLNTSDNQRTIELLNG